MNSKQAKLPIAFWIIAVIGLIWNCMGAYHFLAQVFISPEALAEMEEGMRSLYENVPLYQNVVFGLAVFRDVQK